MNEVIWCLLLLNIFQLVFWSRQVQRLVDKLMSRNYHEYKLAQEPPAPTLKIEDPGVPDDMRSLDEVIPY